MTILFLMDVQVPLQLVYWLSFKILQAVIPVDVVDLGDATIEEVKMDLDDEITMVQTKNYRPLTRDSKEPSLQTVGHKALAFETMALGISCAGSLLCVKW